MPRPLSSKKKPRSPGKTPSGDLSRFSGYRWECIQANDESREYRLRERPTAHDKEKFPATEPFDKSVISGSFTTLNAAFVGASEDLSCTPPRFSASKLLGFTITDANNAVHLTVPTIESIEKNWRENIAPYIPGAQTLNIHSSAGIASDLAFAQALLPPGVVVCSTGEEFIHDVFFHIIPEMICIFRARTQEKYEKNKAFFTTELEKSLNLLKKEKSLPPDKQLSVQERALLALSIGYYADIHSARNAWPKEPSGIGNLVSTALNERELSEEKTRFLSRRGFNNYTACWQTKIPTLWEDLNRNITLADQELRRQELQVYVKKHVSSYWLIKLGMGRTVKFFSPARHAKVLKTIAQLQQLDTEVQETNKNSPLPNNHRKQATVNLTGFEINKTEAPLASSKHKRKALGFWFAGRSNKIAPLTSLPPAKKANQASKTNPCTGSGKRLLFPRNDFTASREPLA